MMHLYQAQFEGESEYYNAKDHHDYELQEQSVWKKHAKDQWYNVGLLEDEISDLKDTIRELEDKLEQATSSRSLEQEAKRLQLDKGSAPRPERQSQSSTIPLLSTSTEVNTTRGNPWPPLITDVDVLMQDNQEEYSPLPP